MPDCLGFLVTSRNFLCIFLGCGLSLAASAEPKVVPFAERDTWWIWANPPAVNLPAEHAVTRPEGSPALEVRFAFTIVRDGSVADCKVVHQSEPAFDEGTLCALIALHRYRPAKENPERVAIRTEQGLQIGGVPPAQAKAVVVDPAKL